MLDNKKNYTIEEIKELINKKINNEKLEDDDVLYNKEAQEILKKHLKNDPNNKELLFLLALVQYDDSYIDDEYKKVIATLKKLLNLNYKKDKVLYYLAASYYYDSDYDNKKIQKKIIELLENAIELNNKDSEYWYLLGKVHFFVIKDYDKAIEFHKKAAEINYTETICNNKEYYYYTLGKINLYLGKSQEAIENFKKAIKDSIDYFNDFYEVSNYWHYLGLSYEKNGQYDEALKSYTMALNINVRSKLDDNFYNCLKALKSLYDLYKKLGKNDDALYALKESIEKDMSAPFMIIPNDDKDFKGSETYNDIIEAYNYIIWDYRKSAAACREMLADFYKRYGEYDKAIELYNQISIENYKNIAETYIEAKNYKNAIDTYKMIIKMHPDNELNYYIDIANTFENAENYNGAIDYYNKAIEIDSGNSDYYVNNAEIYKKLENYEEAINYYNKAIEILNKPCKYHEKLAECYEKLGKYNNAIEAYKEYFKIADDELFIYIRGSKLDTLKNIAYLYNKLNDIENRNLYYEKAIKKCRELIKEYRKNKKEYLKEIADIYIKIGNKEKAFEIYNDLIKKYNKEISRNKNDYELLEIQADLYLKIDDKESALETYNKAIEVCLKNIKSFENKKILISDNDYKNKRDSYMESLSYLAFFYQKISKPDKSIHIYEELIKIYKENMPDKEDNIIYLESIAELYIKLNQKDNALKTYKRILEIDKDNNEAKENIKDIESGKEVETAYIFELWNRKYKQ
ncbi:tetratricopeptide repeat protein [Brachyspira hampsonii]|uniref:tetratricopeptide repeat protein n=1 Tax=Brachyspira hampsonii TaxID=1287055 RepID=UPI001CA5A2E2|nr:tetratricopeptide repeat protein [Brachyspira hampsonii]MBW5394862.1 tetratricopeptide repeat protein [Brachyspira hampsonii]